MQFLPAEGQPPGEPPQYHPSGADLVGLSGRLPQVILRLGKIFPGIESFDKRHGTTLHITGYRSSSGTVRDLTVELLNDGAYSEMLRQDVRLLEAADLAVIFGAEAGDLQLADYLTARDQLLDSRRKAAYDRADRAHQPYKGAEYASLGGSLARLPDVDGALYLQRLKVLRGVEVPKPAKGAIPKAKQEIIKRLKLPTGAYVQSLRLEDGKFEDLHVVASKKL